VVSGLDHDAAIFEAAPRLEHLKGPRLRSPRAWTVIGGLLT